MCTFQGKDLSKLLNGRLVNTENPTITGFSTDTRTLTVGDLYIPLRGENFDGHDFFEDAINKGANLVLSEHETNVPAIIVKDTKEAMYKLANLYRNKMSAEIVAITGSDGKTTTKDIMANILSAKYKVHKTKENLNNEIGLCQMIFSTPIDTEIVILEMGMENFGEISLLTKIAEPNIAVITNIGDAHILQLKSRENIARAKLEILKGLKESGIFLYNADDPILREIVKEYDLPDNTISFGENKEATFILELIQTDSKSTSINLNHQIFTIPLSGKYQMYNASIGIIIGKMKGLDYQDLAQGLNNIEITKMRNERFLLEDSILINDAYNASPQALQASLEMIYEFNDYNQKILILGDMLELGPREVEIHKEIGRNIDPKKIDLLITTGSLAKFLGEAAKENFSEERVYHLNKEKISSFVLEEMTSKSLIFVKASRGMALETVVDEIKNNFIK